MKDYLNTLLSSNDDETFLLGLNIINNNDLDIEEIANCRHVPVNKNFDTVYINGRCIIYRDDKWFLIADSWARFGVPSSVLIKDPTKLLKLVPKFP